MTEAAETEPEAEGGGIGQRLRRAREARSLSIEQVAGQLFLDRSTLERLEREDWEALPPPTFVQGYIRNYARLLGLDPERLLAGFHPPQPPPAPGAGRSPARRLQPVLGWRPLLILLVLLLVLGLAWYLLPLLQQRLTSARAPATGVTVPPVPEAGAGAASGPEKPPVSTPAAPAASSPVPAGAPAPAVVPGSTAGPGAAGAGSSPVPAAPVPAAPTAPAAASASATTGVPPSEPPAATAAPPASAMPAATTQPAAASGRTVPIELDLSQDSWVSLRDARGRRLVHGLLRAGGHFRYQAVLPVAVVLGNVHGVTLQVDGRPFPLTGYNRRRVARFRIPVEPAGTPGRSGPSD